MSSEPHGLLAATQRRTADTRSRARSTIRRMDHEGRLINFVTVSRAARVSRDLLYRDPELRAEIERLRTGRSTAPRLPSAHRASQESLIQRLHGLRAEITALREENQLLRTHLAAHLGEERIARTSKTEPEN